MQEMLCTVFRNLQCTLHCTNNFTIKLNVCRKPGTLEITTIYVVVLNYLSTDSKIFVLLLGYLLLYGLFCLFALFLLILAKV